MHYLSILALYYCTPIIIHTIYHHFIANSSFKQKVFDSAFIYSILSYRVTCFNEIPFIIAFTSENFSILSAFICNIFLFIALHILGSIFNGDESNIENILDKNTLARIKRLQKFEIISSFIITIPIIITIGFIKEIYAELGIIQFSDLLSFVAQAKYYTDNTDVILPFLNDHFLNLFLPSLVLIVELIYISLHNITIPKTKISFKIPNFIIPLAFLIPLVVIWNKVIISDAVSSEAWFSSNVIIPRYDMIVPPTKLKNLILYQVEAFDNSYTSTSFGGVLNESRLPFAESLILNKDYVHFSDRESGKLGGAQETKYAAWSTPATLSTMCALPYLPDNARDINGESNDNFFPKILCMTDILKHFGYELSITFGAPMYEWGYGYIFEKHGCTNFTLASGWEYDHIMIPQFKDNIRKAYETKKPFFAFFSTMDNHRPGRICDDCPNDENKFYRACRCTDNRLREFLDWCKKQPWYEDTVIIVYGDHLPKNGHITIDPGYKSFKKRIYNLHINRQNTKIIDFQSTFRNYTNLDHYPTFLAAAGFTIKGDRLGLGTNLYSNKKTVLEKSKDMSELESQLPGSREWYKKRFLRIQCEDNEPCIDGVLNETWTR